MSKLRFDLKAQKFRSELNAMSIRIGDKAVAHVKNDVFPSESFDGRSWEKAKKPQAHKLLDKTGTMKNSIHVIRANSKGVKWGAGVPYAKYQNDGTKTITSRQFIGMDHWTRKMISEEVKTTFKRIF